MIDLLMNDTDVLRALAEKKSIRNLKQPIVSIKEKKIVGYEALSRGVDPFSGEIIEPDLLFKSARRFGMSLEIDRICREKAVGCFSKHYSDSDILLFLNFNPEILSKATRGSCWMKELVETSGLSPSQIAIEIVESKVELQSDLEEFVNMYRGFGFLIVLDDFGAKHSNLNRVMQLKPDIIKIDRELVDNVSKDFYKRSVVKTVIELARKTSAMSLVEGVENPDDVVTCHELGADLFQGYFFSKPSDLVEDVQENCINRIDGIFEMINLTEEVKIAERQASYKKCRMISSMLCDELAGVHERTFDDSLSEFIINNQEIECAYILNQTGLQVSDTHCGIVKSSRSESRLFKPSQKGADHSLKTYFSTMRILKLKEYFSDPYISLATGNMCRTMSVTFECAEGKECIVCVDFSQK